MAKSSLIALALVAALSQSAFSLAGQHGVSEESIDRIALFRAVGAMYGLDPALLGAIATAESHNDAHKVSRKGAMGLMQLMPATAWQFSVADPFDPVDSTLGAGRFLSSLRRHRACRDLPQLIAAYNAGLGAVERYRGIPPYAETREYVRRVLWLYLLGTDLPGQSRVKQQTTENLPPKGIVRSHALMNGDQAILNQLADLKRRRAAAVKAH
jgi:soluble lytic murein transglycosylase-like protein